ncbi:MAG: hypothetical protein WCJ56_14110, partial [bacterium]
PYHEYPDYIPRKIIGGPQDITGTTRIGGNYFSALFPVLKEEWKPELLTAWHNDVKVVNPELPVEIFQNDPVRAFLSYPLDIKPAPIGSKLPKVWEAPGLGYYVIRSGWGPDAFIAQALTREQIIGGWSGANAGTYRLLGLGQEWATGTTDRYRSRQQESIVWFPESSLEDGARGHRTYFKADDKTMVLSMNLDEVYERDNRYWLTSFGQLRYPVVPAKGTELPPPSGITGMRSIAFDYSGESGAPCLYAIVDKIDGGKTDKRLWLFQPPADKRLSTDAQGFTVNGRAASLHGVFAYPANPKVNTTPLTWEYVNNVGINRGAKHTVTINAVSVPGQDSYFYVATVGAKQPEVKVDGTGLDATVTVGNRTVKFDGTKIVFGTVK